MIGRLNVGGPSIQALTLTRRLADRSYETVLIRGQEAPLEGSMDHLAAELGVAPVRFASLRREFGAHDLLALVRTIVLLARTRPQVLHTHAAKAGAVGRTASLLMGRAAPPVRIHTFHGHVLTGYFGRRRSALFLVIERFLARRTTRLVAVSDEVKNDLVALGVAPAARIEVIPLGFDLEPFRPPEAQLEAQRAAFRATLGMGSADLVVTLVARLVAIKRVDRFLRIARLVHERRPEVRFVVVGDGELRDDLHSSDDAVALGESLVWAGMRSNMPEVYAASDVIVLTSDNEGTPVSLIEAQAAGLPTIATAVGGVPSVVVDGLTGFVVAPDDDGGFAVAIERLTADQELRTTMGARGREHVCARYTLDRLVDDVDALYRGLLNGGAAA